MCLFFNLLGFVLFYWSVARTGWSNFNFQRRSLNFQIKQKTHNKLKKLQHEVNCDKLLSLTSTFFAKAPRFIETSLHCYRSVQSIMSSHRAENKVFFSVLMCDVLAKARCFRWAMSCIYLCECMNITIISRELCIIWHSAKHSTRSDQSWSSWWHQNPHWRIHRKPCCDWQIARTTTAPCI